MKRNIVILVGIAIMLMAGCNGKQKTTEMDTVVTETPENSVTEDISGVDNNTITEIPPATTEIPVKAELSKIMAVYEGDTDEGTYINDSANGIKVTAVYNDGTSRDVSDWKVKNPSCLIAGKTSKYKIIYQNKKCKLKIKCTTKKHRKGRDGVSDEDIYDLEDSFDPHKVDNDVTGRWRVTTIADDINIEEYALSYYESKFHNDKEIHGIVNFTYNTTTCISVMGKMLDVAIHEYVKGEEHDADLLFGGMLLKEYHIYIDNGDIIEVK